MSEPLELIQGLLREQREAQHRANSMLGDLRVDVAAMQRLQESQNASLAEIRVDIRQIYDRLREAEMNLQQVPALEQEIREQKRRHEEIERRLRALEGDGREQRVVNGAVASGAKVVWHYLAGALVAALIAALVAAAREGSGTRQIAAARSGTSIGEPAVR